MDIRWNSPEPNKPLVSDVITKIRYKLSDLQVNKYSDEELLVAINEAVTVLWEQLAIQASSLTHKVIGYSLNGTDHALLPDDYVSLVRIEKAGKEKAEVLYPKKVNDPEHVVYIEGGTVFGKGDVKVVYNYLPREVTLVSDFLDIPFSLIRDIVAIASNYVTNNTDGAVQRATEGAQRVSERREFGPLARRKAFP